MKLVEFAQPLEKDLPYDVVEDAIVFMKNDPKFYRKHYYPAVTKIADLTRAGKKVDPNKCLGPMIETGCRAYVEKYNIGKSDNDIFNLDDRQAMMNMIYSEELKQIEKGDYL